MRFRLKGKKDFISVSLVLQELKFLANNKHLVSMAKFGIKPKTKVYGVPVPALRKIAKIIKITVKEDIGRHALALKLWDSGIHEARLLASFIDEITLVTQKQFKNWVLGFDSWDICDQVCGNLFWKISFIPKKTRAPFFKGARPSTQIGNLSALVFTLSKKKPEFVKRTAFALIAYLAVHNKKLKDSDFINFFPIIKRESIDQRNFVKKAVNWALRQIGKRNKNLNIKAIRLAREIVKIDSKSAKWIAKSAITELESQQIQQRFNN
ncbi:MAG: hypothetical protein UR31_C0008G0014 [Parcubacteria group bacterium GW2011_GWA2_33_14]|uniref:DNA alkylation repair protein n=1 Tax=Candidatus Staskawiczbacteria bacterium RIFCSPHIGHO2_02_FULL_33_16 TaxID=1802204 RepID=A0A1G2HVA3_9BACT|nr:MAG: hypothetical protein UR31_C0008G0014 [Parcubacteria group bacterium GW2011_GWA2_33_14]OGZ66383.1 MAG: hypothetical protein A3D34_02835 [Candidatus Staskawiczbacteria bacterium RIFCSPHIGHO2_02_FULL_33_16]OGZ70529.1 MAG: hypothetical protein A2980_01095 [Candidatus Staskawiczbacteria bacterium RIFCSPLOWO2_01_FULL_33_13]